MRIAPLCGIVGLFGLSVNSFGQVLAFPEAEGFGRFATGGRANLASATVYHVTNLNDSGAGSLRDALSASNRFVVFDVGGIINLNSVVTVASNIYIAGQTAPGGIGVYNNRVAFHGANNLISRYWNVRLGSSQGREDAAGLVRGQNMIWDHMSISWGVDGTFDINPDSGQIIDNITIQNSSVSQGLDVVGHSTGGLLTIGQGNRSSIIKSLWADNVTRNPKLRGDNEFINNVVYGYQTSGYIMGDTTGMTSNANIIGNYFIEGPIDGSSPLASGTATFNVYGSDNRVDGDKDGILDGTVTSSYPGANVIASPHAFPTTTTMSSTDAVQFVINNFGPNITRDAVDKRLAQEVASYGTLGGVIDRETDLFPGYGTDPVYLNPRARLVDSDADGMPDNWETSKGYNPASNSDWKTLNGSYTRLENYLNELGAYETTRTVTAAGNWTNPAAFGGTLSDFSSAVTAPSGTNQTTGNAFARRAFLSGTTTVSGGTLDIFDTALIGNTANGVLSISGGTLSAGQIVLGATGRTGTLNMTGGTLQTGPIVSGGGTSSASFNGGTFKATGTMNIAVPTTIGVSGLTVDSNGFTGGFNGSLTGSGNITKIGTGSLTLGGVNTTYSGQVNLTSGTVVLATNAANSSTGAINAANGTTVSVTTSGASVPLALNSGAGVTLTGGGLTYNGAISGPAGTTLTLSTSASGTSNFSIGGSLTGFSGTFTLGSSTGNVRIGSTGSSTAAFNTGTSTGTIRSSFDGTVNFGSLSGASTTFLQGSTNGTVASTYVIGALNTSTTFSGLISNGTNATPAKTNITKTGSGTLTLANTASTYTGVTTISGGTLAVSALVNGGFVSNIGQSTSDAANLVLDGGTLRYTGGTVTTDRLMTLSPNGGSIDASGSGTLSFGSTLDIAASATGNRTLTLTGTNTGFNGFSPKIIDPTSGATSLTKSGNGTWRLFNTHTYSGNTNVTGGSLYLIGLNTLPYGTGKGDLTISSGALVDMYGNSQTVNGLNGAGTITTTINTIRTLTVGTGNASGNFTGTLTQGASQTLNLIKTGTGTQTLNGTYNYTGSTTVSGGELRTIKALQNNTDLTINSSAVLNVPVNGTSTAVTKVKSLSIPTSGANYLGTMQLHDNDLVIDYGATASSYASVMNMIKSGLTLLGGNGTGIASSEVDAQSLPGTIFGVIDNGAIGGQITSLSGFNGVTTNSVLVKFTWFGDANLDGQIDGSDYALLDSGFTSGGALTGWVFGDFDYSGVIDGSDFALIDTGLTSQSGVLPEPGSLGLLAITTIGMLRRRKNRLICRREMIVR